MNKMPTSHTQSEPLAEGLTEYINPHLFEQVLDASGVATAIRDAQLAPLFANKPFRDFYGRSLRYIQSTPKNTGLTPETVDLYDNEILPAMQAGLLWEGSYQIRTPEGGVRQVWSRFTPVLDDEGSLTHVVSIMRDASEADRMRKAMTKTERHLSFLAKNTSDSLFRLRLSDGGCDYISPAIESLTGYSRQDFYDTPGLFLRLCPEEWNEAVKHWWHELRQGFSRYDYEIPLVHLNGSRQWVHLRIKVITDDTAVPRAIEGIISSLNNRSRAESTRIAARENLSFITNSTSDIFFRFTLPDGTYDYMSPSIKRFSGYAPEEYDNISLFSETILHPDWRGYYQECWAEMLQGKSRPAYEYQFIHKSGEVRWASQRVVMVKDEDGVPVAVEGIVTDITERKTAEENARESESRFRTLFEEAPISLWEEDLTALKKYFDELKSQGIKDFRRFFYDNPDALARCAALVRVVDVNKATLNLLGAGSKEDLFGNLTKILTESSMAAFTEEMILLASGGYEYCGEITHRTLDGETIWVMVHFFVPPEYASTLSRVIVSLLDVTPRKKAEEALMDSEERYRILAENSQEGVLVVQDDTVMYTNERMTDIFGIDAREVDRDALIKALHPEDREGVLSRIDDFLSGSRREAFLSLRAITPRGEVRWLTLTLKPITWGGREARLKLFTDVTHHKALETELLRAHAEMENRIRKRTLELSKANVRLKAEALERGKAQERILTLTQQLIRIQEDERKRISRDLHDNVAQDLSSVMLKMETLFDDQHNVDSQLHGRREEVTGILRKAIASVRSIAYGLRPPALEQLGLVEALRILCKDVSAKHRCYVDFFATGIEDIPLDFDAEINIYRMIQEAMRNIARHADATKASVRMVTSHPDILIRIEDNGCGFDHRLRLEEAVTEKRMGVRSMEERARLIGGTLEIHSLPGTGTRVLFKIPIENARRRD